MLIPWKVMMNLLLQIKKALKLTLESPLLHRLALLLLIVRLHLGGLGGVSLDVANVGRIGANYRPGNNAPVHNNNILVPVLRGGPQS